MDWTAGYVTDLEYTHGYYRELSPSLLKLACLNAGVAPPAGDNLTYLELGFGQGVSFNIHAAANSGVFWGTDFNPSQAAHARALAKASGSNAMVLDDSFAELAARPDLPDFDVIVLHGIWSWISRENQTVIVDLIRRKLRVGGLVYISYNCLPGWAPAAPLRHLMNLHADLAGSDAVGTGGKIDGALRFVQQVIDSGAIYFRAYPAVAERLKGIANQNRNYLAHEYFNRDWDVMTFSEVAAALDEAKVTFVASAHLLDHIDAVNITPDGQKLLASLSHPVLQQSVRDYLVSAQFRRDIFIKGPRRLTPLERNEALRAQSFALITQPDNPTNLKVSGALGQGQLQGQIYGPLLEVMAERNYAPHTLAELVAHPKLQGLKPAQVLEAVLILVGSAIAAPAREGAAAGHKTARALNQAICRAARSRGDTPCLASPVTGSGVDLPRLAQLFILAIQEGKTAPSQQVAYAWELLKSQNQRMVKDGKSLESDADNIAILDETAERFDKRLPIYKALDIL